MLQQTTNGAGKQLSWTVARATASPSKTTEQARSVKLMRLSLDDLYDNPVQPPNRTTGSDMADLIEDIREKGVINPPYVAFVDGEYYKIDGHRRCVAWASLGHRDIQCRVIKAADFSEAERTFVSINGLVKRISGKEWFYGWAVSTNRDAYLNALKKGQARRIRDLVKVFGAEEATQHAKAGLDPCILNYIYMANRFITQHTAAPKLVVIGRWIIAHRGTWLVRELVARGLRQEALRLAKCIKEDKPFVRRGPKVKA